MDKQKLIDSIENLKSNTINIYELGAYDKVLEIINELENMPRIHRLMVEGDWNDADYNRNLVEIDEDTFQKFLPLINAIQNYTPYIQHNEFGDIDYHNWDGGRQDLGEKTLYEKYSQFNSDLIDEFIEVFSLYGYEDCPLHTINLIKDIDTNEELVNYDYWEMHDRHTDKVKEFLKRKEEIYNHKTKYGVTLAHTPYNKMTPEETALIEEAHNLWKKYCD